MAGKSDDINYEIFAGLPPRSMTSRGDMSPEGETYSLVSTHSYSLGNRGFEFHKLDNSWLNADLVIAEHAIRNFVTFKWSYLHRPQRFALWGHGKTYTKPNTRLESKLKTNLVNRSDWFFAYTQGGVDSVVAKGFPLERTTVVQNSTDTTELSRLRIEIALEEVANLKKSLGLRDGPVAVFVGALDPSKRLPFLFDATTEIQRKIPNFQLLVFGDGPERNYVEGHSNQFIKYLGRAEPRMQALISLLADVILIPGAVGLIAVDSFALGLPIITTNWPWHGPEFEYLTSGVNSLITKDSVQIFADETVRLLSDTMRLEVMKINCLKNVDPYSLEKMVANFHRGVLCALETPSRRSAKSLRRG